MIELNVNGLMKFYGANKLFENISFEVKTGERIGLIGQNGCGKTTLMKILMGLEEYQGGEISLRKDTKIGYLNQIPVYEKSTTTLEVLQMAFESVYLIRKQMEDLEHSMGFLEGDALEKVMNSYARLQEQYELNHGYELDTRIDKITEGLQIDENMKHMLFEQLSGGEKTRVILGKILLEEPDILLLDEPTNHLDLVTIEWLEDFLKEYRGSALIISHDRFFLDTVVSKIYEMEYDHVEQYLGNYSYYVVEKERRFLIEYRNYQNQQRKIERMEKQIERYRIWGVMRDSETMFKRAKELEKRLEKIDVMDRPIAEKRKIRLKQTSVGRSGKIVLEFTEVSKSFGTRQLLHDINLGLFYQDSACIIGENGSGKTTLLKMILEEEAIDEGSIRLGANVKIGYLPQHVEYPDEEQTVLEYFARLHDLTNGAARSQLAKVLFLQEDVNKKIKYLSGGEKSRLRLCSLTFEGANLLILDEPTNHLDVDSREVLEETLNEFEGTLLFVSHDRYFINKLADKVITIDAGTLNEYDGDYAYYQEEHKKELDRKSVQVGKNTAVTLIKQGKQPAAKDKTKLITEAGQTSMSKISSNNSTDRVNKKPARKLEQLELAIEELEDKLKVLQGMMELHNTDGIRLAELFAENKKLEAELEIAYLEWEQLQME
ncbi:MAG: abc-f [Herbinix sp.]|jgi:ATPase subunit of ABC transporter with duplicated ATPase domains|nr:abc-f [Herbinix sp.]